FLIKKYSSTDHSDQDLVAKIFDYQISGPEVAEKRELVGEEAVEFEEDKAKENDLVLTSQDETKQHSNTGPIDHPIPIPKETHPNTPLHLCILHPALSLPVFPPVQQLHRRLFLPNLHLHHRQELHIPLPQHFYPGITV
ncbi:hypothetical protein C3L33_10256, partial [Rhododendron williamsianum]